MRISRLRIVPLGTLLALLAGVGWQGPSAWAGNPKADPSKPAIVLPKDPKTVVLRYDPGAGGFLRKGPPPYLQIQADGQVLVTNPHDGSKKESKLTLQQVQDLLHFVIQDNDFFNVTAAKINDGIKAAAGKGPFLRVTGAGTSVIAVQANGKQHEVSFRAAGAYLRAYPKLQPLAQFAAVEKRLSDLALSVAKGK